MGTRTRKLIGATLLLFWVVVWPFIALGFAQTQISRFYAPAQLIFFLLLGCVWIVPAAYIIRWMHKPEKN